MAENTDLITATTLSRHGNNQTDKCGEVVKVKLRALFSTTDLLLILNQVRARIVLT